MVNPTKNLLYAQDLINVDFLKNKIYAYTLINMHT